MKSTTSTIGAALAVAAIAGVCIPAAADTTFNGTMDNNWFNAANWSGGVVPSASIFKTNINGGHAVTATLADAAGSSVLADWLFIGGDGGDGLINSLTSEVDVGTIGGDLFVGYGRFQPGSFTGRLNVNNADVMAGDVYVASVSGGADRFADGRITINNGSLTTEGSIDIGYVFQDANNATGSVSLTNGNMTSLSEFASITVGTSVQSSPGKGTGSLYMESGTLSGFYGMDIGVGFSGTGGAEGIATLIDVDASFGDGGVDLGFDAAYGSGTLILDGSYLATSGHISLNEGSTLEMHIDGTTRAAAGDVGAGRYSAIDVTTETSIFLEGNLDIDFDFTPSFGDTFDLITMPVDGTFYGSPSSVDFIDLASGLSAMYEIVPGDMSSGPVFRVSIVPEPTSVALLAMGSVALLRRKRERC